MHTLQTLQNIEENINYFVGFCGHNKNLTKEQYYKLSQIECLLVQVSSIKSILNEIYLDYVNNYLTIDCMAEKEGLKKEDLEMLIELGRKINHKEYRVIY